MSAPAPPQPRYRHTIEARQLKGTRAVTVNVSVYDLGLISIYSGVGVTSSLDGLDAEALHAIGNACLEAARVLYEDTAGDYYTLEDAKKWAA